MIWIRNNGRGKAYTSNKMYLTCLRYCWKRRKKKEINKHQPPPPPTTTAKKKISTISTQLQQTPTTPNIKKKLVCNFFYHSFLTFFFLQIPLVHFLPSLYFNILTTEHVFTNSYLGNSIWYPIMANFWFRCFKTFSRKICPIGIFIY